MPELKNTFTGGRMEKDQDERIVGTGLYREALNIEVSTSEDSDVGAVQNILGNIKVTEAIAGPIKEYHSCGLEDLSGPPTNSTRGRYYGTNNHIAHVVDPQEDKLYRFIATNGYTGSGYMFGTKDDQPGKPKNHGVWMDRIVEYDTNSKIEEKWQRKEQAVMVDVYKVATKVSHINIVQPPEPVVTEYGCYENACVDCDSIGGCTGTTWSNDPLCGGGTVDGCAPQTTYGCTDSAVGDNPDISNGCVDGTTCSGAGCCGSGNGYLAFNYNPAATQDDGSCIYEA